jgi:hypothetical protein
VETKEADTPIDLSDREAALVELGRQPRFAHQLLFKHRHPQATPTFHYEMIDDLWSSEQRVLELAFRGAGKSTIAEEYICLAACFQKFRNFIIVGESATRACERLAAIKHELDFNEWLLFLFGNMHGPVWNEDKVVLSNGTVIQAFGRLQSLRGTKHDDARPDGCLIDDIEDEESVNTPEGRNKAELWLMRTLLPALAPGAKVRMLANVLDPDCLAMRLKKAGGWLVREYPWEYISKKDGRRRATWPSRFSLAHIDHTRSSFQALGRLNEYMQEFMVQAVDPSSRTFTSDMFKIIPRVRTWEPVFAMYDPARSIKATSAHTGKVVFSWIGQKLIVWEADGQHWMPDQILADIFQTAETYQPIKIGVEKEGLEEFLLQPIRTEMVRRNTIIPVVAMPAPAGKIQFIRSLQPFFMSGQVEFVKELPILREQLLSFPTGRIDVPNALAYALRMRPGLPVYENFGFKNVQDEIPVLRAAACYLAINATRQHTAAVLVQRRGGILLVLRDWLAEGDPGAVLDNMVRDVRLAAPADLTFFAPPVHFKPLDNIGLMVAANRARIRLTSGGREGAGREEVRRLIDTTVRDLPALLVSTRARWTLNALAGGYARSVVKAGQVSSEADEGSYKVLAEALESFCAVMAGLSDSDADFSRNYAIDARGRQYLSARAEHGAQQRKQR